LTGLQPAKLYHYRVLSRDAAGNLGVSSDGTFTTAPPPDTTPPSVPTGLVSMTVSTTQIDLNWSDSSDNVGVTGYRIYRNGVQIGTSGLSSHSDKNLTPSSTYAYSVSAYDAAGNASALSSVVNAVTLSPGATTTVLLRPAADTFLNLDRNVNATSEFLNTYTWPDNQIANVILMKFDFSGIPKGATIQSATLNLALIESDPSADGSYTVTAHKIINQNPDLTRATGLTYDGINGWTPNSCCFGQIPLAQADISAPYDTKSIDKVSGYKSWNITPLVNEWVNQGVANRGLMLNGDPTKQASHYRLFASMEYPDPSLWPSLTITYQLP
jgi:hypothetical protein